MESQADRVSVISSVMSTASVQDRGGFGGQLEFVLTMIGFAVGLGNVWRFPYLCYANGGGAFLIPYFTVLILVGIPLYLLELSLGQFSSRGPLAVWVLNPMFKGLGVAMQIVAAYIVCYCNVIVAWCLFYFMASMTANLPWEFCGNPWNTPACVDKTMNLSIIVDENGTIGGLRPVTPSEEYFYNNVLQLSPGIDEPGVIVWQLALLLMVAWVIIFIVLINGVASVGKAAYFVSLFPYVLLTILLGQAATLDGALDGIKYYMTPEWERLKDAQVWGDAAAQIFYSLGICMGSLIAMSSYNKFNNNLIRDSVMIPIINCLTSVYAGFVVFSMLGFIAKEKNLDIDEVAQDGPGLIFVVYPEGLASLSVAPLWATLFFFMMSLLGFSSQFSMAEGVCAGIVDEYPILLKRKYGLMLRAGYCLVNYLLGLPMVLQSGFYLFNIMNDYSASYPLFFAAIMEMIAISWIYDFRRFARDIEMMLGSKPNYYWLSCWVVVSPLVVMAVLGFSIADQGAITWNDYVYPPWSVAMTWLIVGFPVVVTFGWMIGYVCKEGGAAVCAQASKPLKPWGPARSVNRTGIYADKLIDLASVSSESSDSGASSLPEKNPPPYNIGIPNKAFDSSHDDNRTPDLTTKF